MCDVIYNKIVHKYCDRMISLIHKHMPVSDHHSQSEVNWQICHSDLVTIDKQLPSEAGLSPGHSGHGLGVVLAPGWL